MLTRIDNDADVFAMLQAVDLEGMKSFPQLLSLIAGIAPPDEDIEIIIRSRLLPDSYRINPSMLAKNTYGKLESDSFQSSAAYTLSPTHVSIKFSREPREPGTNIRSEVSTSVEARILRWLNARIDGEPDTALDIPIDEVVPSVLRRPEQIVYNVKRRTGIRTKITSFKRFIRIVVKG